MFSKLDGDTKTRLAVLERCQCPRCQDVDRQVVPRSWTSNWKSPLRVVLRTAVRWQAAMTWRLKLKPACHRGNFVLVIFLFGLYMCVLFTVLCMDLVYVYGFYHAMHFTDFSAKRGIAIACRLSVCLSVCL